MNDLMEIGLRLVLAVALAGVIGVERERKGRAAGLRTHVLVCLGAALMMVMAEVFATELGEWEGAVSLDMSRIAAGVITGVGFLGAGTIINVGGEQRGLTTAAMVWFVAALGIAIGAGMYAISILATALALLAVLGLKRLEMALPATCQFHVTVRLPSDLNRVTDVESAVRAKGFRVDSMNMEMYEAGKTMEASFSVTLTTRQNVDQVMASLAEEYPEAERITLERRAT